MFERTVIEELKNWALKPDRKPLILRGARQSGKTTVVDLFARQFSQYIVLNLDVKQDRQLFERGYTIHELTDAIFLYKNAERKNEKTMIFIDEIQNSPEAVAMLRYFYEQEKSLYVIAAGSLLESLMIKNISFPVGRVEYMSVRPCSFPEFVLALGEEKSYDHLNELPFPEYAHEKLLKLFNTFTYIGGMPEVVQNYSKNRTITALNPIYEGLIASYLDDVEKYARNETLKNVIRHTIQHSFFSAGTRIRFQGFGNSPYKNREMSEAFKTLEKAFFLQLVYPVTVCSAPLQPNIRRSPKLQMVDTGMVNFAANLQNEIFGVNDLCDTYKGKIAEHITGQELLALQRSVLFKLNYWSREEKNATSEVDFIVQYKGLIIPVEIKSGASGRLRSLHQFVDRSPHPYAIRIYSGKLSINKHNTIKGTPYKLLNLPFYLINKINEYIMYMID